MVYYEKSDTLWREQGGRRDEKGGSADDDQKSYQKNGRDVQMQKLLLIAMKNAASPEENSGLFVFETPGITRPAV
jgi:hypothetical protein